MNDYIVFCYIYIKKKILSTILNIIESMYNDVIQENKKKKKKTSFLMFLTFKNFF